ncbi:transglycosylase SLT domain-containing protein [Pandoraea apista]|uniref:Lytic transglycosylase domain-containing protein n=2 Tax=Pandoraea apista TaxID=93218 RepID=A0ABX9ZIY9_9BURK|nr:transglycosylase SLT domain-containing protein [Pandoraea apista]PTE02711.1 transglycosylase [Pandoraea apista]RRJ26327.1 lytic transglycosylase domain-containing protein [Pandoraea apista]RRJ72912.1 lytic transglycosylase domain-containing protein [Pandoraea apista]RSC97865.1 lytic transglycosylase domain-containing protein [Pandoraea apista]RSK75284.1 lytic transglycosylase domain-containing protein [Pandoraea apista]
MPIDDLYADTTDSFLRTSDQFPTPTPRADVGTSIGSITRAVGRGLGQGGATLFGAASDLAAGAAEAYIDPTLSAGAALNPGAAELVDRHVNEAIAKARGGHLFESRLGMAAYDLADTFKANPSDTSRVDQIVQGAVSGLTQIVPAAVLGGPLAGAAVGGMSLGMGRSEELKREGVDVGTRSAVGAVSGAFGAAGAVLPVAGGTLAQTAALVGFGGPGMAIGQGYAERAILRNADYKSLADQIDPLDPVNIAAATVMAGVMGAGAHAIRSTRGGNTGSLAPAPDLTTMPVAERKSLPYNHPSLDAYATRVAQQNGVPADFLLFLKNGGERSNSNQVSPKGAKGVMQFIDDTWTAYGKGADPTDPVASIDAAGAYARDLLARYDGNVRAAAAEYNGGVSQAKRVMAGLEPNKAETAAYLKRLDNYHVSPEEMRFTPAGEQVDAALTMMGRRMLDEAHPFGVSDIDAYNTHQALADFAVRQMNAGAYPDVARYITETDSLHAQALDGMIADAENGYQTLTAQAAQLADPGAVTAARNEIAAMGTRPGDAEVRALTEQIQQQGAKFKDARRQASKQVEQMQADFDARLERLQGAISRNAEGQRAIDALAGAESNLASLREQRAALDVPASKRTPIADYVRQVADAYRADAAAPRPSREVLDAWTSEAAAPVHVAPRVELMRSSGPDAAPALPETAGTTEANLRALQDAEPETRVHVDADRGQVEGTIGDVMKVIDDEHAAALEDSKLFEVAANCFISRGI